MSQPGLLTIISGPSGAGKGTLCERLCREVPGIAFSVSATTRPPRPGEREGVDYFFVREPEFDRMLNGGEFLEWTTFDGHRYGTPRRFVEQLLGEGKDVLLDIEVQGARQVKDRYPEAVSVFILPPSREELRRRLLSRGTDPGQLERRLRTAEEQIKHMAGYDYVVVNDEVRLAVEKLRSIIVAEKCRITRQDPDLLKFLW